MSLKNRPLNILLISRITKMDSTLTTSALPALSSEEDRYPPSDCDEGCDADDDTSGHDSGDDADDSSHPVDMIEELTALRTRLAEVLREFRGFEELGDDRRVYLGRLNVMQLLRAGLVIICQDLWGLGVDSSNDQCKFRPDNFGGIAYDPLVNFAYSPAIVKKMIQLYELCDELFNGVIFDDGMEDALLHKITNPLPHDKPITEVFYNTQVQNASFVEVLMTLMNRILFAIGKDHDWLNREKNKESPVAPTVVTALRLATQIYDLCRELYFGHGHAFDAGLLARERLIEQAKAMKERPLYFGDKVRCFKSFYLQLTNVKPIKLQYKEGCDKIAERHRTDGVLCLYRSKDGVSKETMFSEPIKVFTELAKTRDQVVSYSTSASRPHVTGGAGGAGAGRAKPVSYRSAVIAPPPISAVVAHAVTTTSSTATSDAMRRQLELLELERKNLQAQLALLRGDGV